MNIELPGRGDVFRKHWQGAPAEPMEGAPEMPVPSAWKSSN